jgi:hypothetical protein
MHVGKCAAPQAAAEDEHMFVSVSACACALAHYSDEVNDAGAGALAR